MNLKSKASWARSLSTEDGAHAAELSVLNALAAIKSVCGSLDKVKRIVKLTGFVACTDNYIEQPKVMNGASELLVKIFGEKRATCT